MIRIPNPRTIFYGWWMVTAAFGIQFLTSGLLNQSYGSYVVALGRDFGWTKTELSGAYSLQQLQMGLLGPGQGWLLDRIGPRPMMRVGILLLGAGFIVFSQINSIPAFYAAFMLMSIGSSLSGFFPVTVAIVNWFEKKRAKALSTTTIGFALGGVVVPVVAFALDHFGWRETAFASGILIVVIGLPLTQFIRHKPEEIGEVVDGVRERPVEEKKDAVAAPVSLTRDFTFREAIHTWAYWFVSFGHSSALLVVAAVNVHVISHLKEDLGYSLATAGLIYTMMTVFQVAGMIIGGILGDKSDNTAIATVCMGMHALGLLIVAFAVDFPMVLAFSVLHGLAWGIRGPLMQAIRADYFGRSAFGMIMGFSSLITMIGLIAGPLIAGYLADVTGGYKAGFTILAGLAALGSVFFVLAKKPPRPLNEAALAASAAPEGQPA